MLTLSAQRFATATGVTLLVGTAVLALGAERLVRGSAALGAALVVAGLGVTVFGLTLRVQGEADRDTLLLLTRSECAACDEARDVLDRLRVELGFDLWVVDIDTVEGLRAEHGDEVPVVYRSGTPVLALQVGESDVRGLFA